MESNWDSIAAASTHLERLPLHFWDKPAATVSKIRGAAATIQNPRLMLMYGKEASNRKQEIDRQHYTIPNQRPKDKHCGKI